MHNEFNAIRLCIIKAVGSVTYQKGGKFAHLKKISVDVPCSKQLFQTQFVDQVEEIAYCGENNYKCSLAASHLEVVLGKHWHNFKYRNSSTQ